MTCINVKSTKMGVPVQASNDDSDFKIKIGSQNNVVSSSTSVARVKTDATSTYVNHKATAQNHQATGPLKFRAYVFGGTDQKNLVDCSSYKADGTPRPKAIVTRGTRGYIRQLEPGQCSGVRNGRVQPLNKDWAGMPGAESGILSAKHGRWYM